MVNPLLRRKGAQAVPADFEAMQIVYDKILVYILHRPYSRCENAIPPLFARVRWLFARAYCPQVIA
jgi:hypothetical protein